MGAIEAEQSENERTVRNDRIIAVASVCSAYRNIREISDLNQNLVAEIEHFFVSYNAAEGRQFKPIGRADSEQAGNLVRQAGERLQQSRNRPEVHSK